MVGGGFLVITVSHPTFCCVGVGVVVEVGLGCDNHFILLDDTKNVTVIKITFNNNKKKSNENSYFNLDLVVMRLTRHIHISLCHLVMYESILLGKQRLLIRLLSGMVF